ncbi:hypothetical protein JNM87_03390 [Candidatus Saccharibacteria bacterium]|nr:hypothetical protein [Candidatus Saccharibacteria bacterium]
MNPDNTSAAESQIANPFYAVEFAAHIFKRHTEGPKEDWIVANAHLIADIGAKAWLGELLDTLSQTRAKYDGHDVINPTVVINVSERLQEQHDPTVSRSQWIQANAKLINEIGADKWLWRLLDVLENGSLVA